MIESGSTVTEKGKKRNITWWVLSTPVKHVSQTGNLPQTRVNMKFATWRKNRTVVNVTGSPILHPLQIQARSSKTSSTHKTKSWVLFVHLDVPGSLEMVSKWMITPIYLIYKYRRNNPLILTIDPNFQRDIQAGASGGKHQLRNVFWKIPTKNCWFKE